MGDLVWVDIINGIKHQADLSRAQKSQKFHCTQGVEKVKSVNQETADGCQTL